MNTYAPNRYVPPAAEMMPEAVRPAVDALNAARDRWRRASTALDRVHAELSTAGTTYEAEVVDAARAGIDAEVIDPRPRLAAEVDRLSIALNATAVDVLDRWRDLWAAVADNWIDCTQFTEAPVSAAQRRVSDAEAALAEARQQLAAAYGLRAWVSARRHVPGIDAIRAASNGPRPMSGNLDELRAAEDKAEAKRQADLDAQARNLAESETTSAAPRRRGTRAPMRL